MDGPMRWLRVLGVWTEEWQLYLACQVFTINQIIFSFECVGFKPILGLGSSWRISVCDPAELGQVSINPRTTTEFHAEFTQVLSSSRVWS